MNRFTLYLFLLSSYSVMAKNDKTSNAINYPVTKKINHTDNYFGTTVRPLSMVRE